MTHVPRETSQTVSDMPGRIDLSDWLTKAEAARLIGVSTKAIERWAQAGKLEQRSRPQAHGPNVVVYFPDDVARLASERHPDAPPFVLPAVADPPRRNGRSAAAAAAEPMALALPVSAGEPEIRALFAAALRAVMSQTSETSMSETLFLTIAQAAAVSGLSKACLRRMIRDGTLAAIRDRGWRIRRRDLEQL